ncbi:MAG: hypothetical protein QG670_1943 [Thermoproteota archaeon]|nr:hypothetical protein [Thermoproteota archaeon]
MIREISIFDWINKKRIAVTFDLDRRIPYTSRYESNAKLEVIFSRLSSDYNPN